MKKYRILILLLTVFIVGSFVITILLKENNTNKISLKETSVVYDEPAMASDSEKDLDSVFHKEICSDYNVIWEAYESKKRKFKLVDFNFYSGKLLIYYFDKSQNSKIKPENSTADKVFEWNFYEVRKDNKIIGKITNIEKDTLMYWFYDKDKMILTDEKGMVFKKKVLK